jgi:esterase/lipase superfamily enzyme
MNVADFQQHFVQQLKDKPKQHALLFIHGYNTSFEDAAYRAGQLAWDIPFVGYTGFFSWPSTGKFKGYLTDDAAARSSAAILKRFIGEILENPELEQLHIIAHSMGSLVLTLSLKEIISDSLYHQYLDKIYQLILAAPDIDQKEFRNTILPAFNTLGRRRTMYASDHDLALQTSGLGRGYRDRLGQVGTDIFTAVGLDSIEASNLKTPSGHSYLFQSPMLLSDLFYLLSQGLPPLDRRLREISKVPVNYWLFPR